VKSNNADLQRALLKAIEALELIDKKRVLIYARALLRQPEKESEATDYGTIN